ncbi:unnamed protein product [Phytophthora lilii]|uniref:Unnamed protein product n=1 Tax=Phytophthora lilii TaxID=2077276 RepID=A0A9W6U6V9_9STRA|nr:unnamed protein product [Phytophthora lilii]
MAASKLFLLRYEYVANILQQRVPFRAQHLEHALSAKKRGLLVIGGALADPPDAAVIVFNAEQQQVDKFARDDPYVRNGLVTSYSIREWTVVV